MAEPRASGWREEVFKRRGTLLALPAVLLVLVGKASRGSIVTGLPIALAGEGLRCWAVGFSGATTRGDRVSAPALVTAGPYAYVRNPLYLGNFLTALGFAIAFTGKLERRRRAVVVALGLGMMLAVYAAIVPLEEAYLSKAFGVEFDDYVARVPRVLPRLSPADPQHGTYDASVILAAETRTFATFGAMLAMLLLKALRT